MKIKNFLSVFVCGLVITTSLIVIISSKTNANSRFDNLTVNGFGNAIYIFDKDSGKIYIYEQGKCSEIYQITKLGEPFKILNK